MVRLVPRTMLRAVTATTVVCASVIAIPVVAHLTSANAVAPAITRLHVPAVMAPQVTEPTAPVTVLQPSLRRRLDAVGAKALSNVMVQAGGDLAAAKRAVARAGLKPGVSLDDIGIVTATGTPAQIRLLSTTTGVTRLDWSDEQAEFYGTTDHDSTRAVPVHDGAFDVDANGTLDAFTGAGTSVAIVDSGTDGTHPMFADANGDSRVKKNVKVVCHDIIGSLTDYASVDTCTQDLTVANDTDTSSGGGHGTHVSGIAAGSIVTDSTGRHLRGGAPDADIVAVSTGATLSIYSGTTGLYWVLKHHADPCGDGSCAPIVAVNNSWGPSGGSQFSPTAPNTIVGRKLVEAGVVVVWAAGNDGGDGSANETNGPGADPTPGIMSVANYDDAGTGSRDNDLDPSSSRGLQGSPFTYPDISAPGTNITSACRPYLPICSTGLDTADPDYNTISGTSMAAPHIAGYVAVLQQVSLETTGKFLTPAQIETLLVNNAHQFGSRTYGADPRNPGATTGTSFDAGHGLVDLLAAVSSLTGLTAPEVVGPTCPADARFADPAGDASAVLGTDTPAPSVEALDMTEGWLTTDDAGTGGTDVTFHVKVTDLPVTPGGESGTGEYFDLNFTLGGAGYYIAAQRTAESGETFVLGNFGGASGGRKSLASGLPGRFDPVADTVTVTLPASVWATAALPGSVATGQVIAGLSFVSRRTLVLLVPDADTAAGGCAYVIGAKVTDSPTSPLTTVSPTSPLTSPPMTVSPTVSPTASPTEPPGPSNGAPVIERVGDVRQQGGHTTGRAVRFDVVAVDPDNDHLVYRWDFGNGVVKVVSKTRMAATYAKPGTYRVTVTAYDGELVDRSFATIKVRVPRK